MSDGNPRFILVRRPTGELTEDVFELRTEARPVPPPGEALVRRASS